MRKNGFTLIELLIVVAIIGILAAIAVPNFLNAQTRAKLARSYGDLKSVQTAIATYGVDNNNFAPVDQGTEYGDGSSYIALTTPIAYLSGIDSCRDVWVNKVNAPDRIYCDYGAGLRKGLAIGSAEQRTRIQEYNKAGTTYIMVGSGPDGDTDWPWTNWAAGLQALRTPNLAGPNRDGGAFFSVSNGLNSSGDIVSSSSRIYQ